MTTDAVTVAAWVPDASVVALISNGDATGSDVVILPTRLDDDGRGIYRDVHLMTVKSLQQHGVAARYLHDSLDRTFQSEHSHAVAADLAMWVLSSASWDAVKVMCSYVAAWGHDVTGGRPDAHIRVSVARLTRPDGAELEGLEIVGPSEDVATRVLAELRKMLGPVEDTTE